MILKEFNKELIKSAEFNINNRKKLINASDFVANNKYHKSNLLKRSVFSVASFLVVFAISSFIYLSVTPITTVTIDINPSIEVKLNFFNRVISLDSDSEIGNEFINSLSAKNSNMEGLMNQIYNNGIEAGYFNNNQAYAIIGLESKNPTKEQKIYNVVNDYKKITTLVISESLESGDVVKNLVSDLIFSNDSCLVNSNNDTCSEGLQAPPENFTGDYSYTADLAEIINGLEISDAKLTIILDIYSYYGYSTEADFNNLVQMDVPSLIQIYSSIYN